MRIKNYDSTLSLDNYTLGDVCTFYIHNNHYNALYVAEPQMIDKYSSAISEIINEGTYNDNHGKWAAYTRVIGVVVDKEAAANDKDIDTITAMFKTDRDDYVVMKYIVNTNQVYANKKRHVRPASVLRTA